MALSSPAGIRPGRKGTTTQGTMFGSAGAAGAGQR
jgi:hypothetical protein